MQRPRLKTKMSKKKKAALAAAIALVLALLIGGAFAWTDFSQSFKNLFHGTSTPDVLLHDDFTPNVNKDVYVENTGQTPLVVRVQFAEYLQVGNDAVIGQDAKDSSTWRVRDWSGTTIGSDGTVAATDNLHDWLMSGNSKWYLPGTSEIDDVTYTSAVVGGNGNTTKQTLPAAPVVTMSYYMANKATLDASYPDGFWILDDSDTGSGWCYWSKLLPKDEATNLLLDNVTLNPDMTPDDNWAYNIDVRLQAANKTEAYKLGSVGGISSEGKALINSLLGLNTIANPQDKFDSGSDQLLNLKPVPGYPGLYEVLDDNGKSARPKGYLVDPDGSIAQGDGLTGDEVAADAAFVGRLTKTYPSGLPSGDAEALGESNGYPAVIDSNGDILIDAVNFPDGQLRSMLKNGFATSIYTSLAVTPNPIVADVSTAAFTNHTQPAADTDGDSKLSPAEVSAVTELYLNNLQVVGTANTQTMSPDALTSLEGLELFPDLGVLQVLYFNVDSFSAAANPQLTSLELLSTTLSSIDVTHNPALEDLLINSSKISSLDLSQNPGLKILQVSTNANLKSLDLSANQALERVSVTACTSLTSLNIDGLDLAYLSVANTGISTLDVRGCTSLTNLPAYSCPNLTSINASGLTSLATLSAYGCPDLTTINVQGCSALVTLSAYNCPNLDSLDISGCTALTTLYVNNTAAAPGKLATIDITDTAITNNSGLFRFAYNGAVTIVGAGARTFTNTTYHTPGNTITYAP